MASERRRGRGAWLMPILLAATSACLGEPIRRYPLRTPLWTDPDANPVSGKLEKEATSGLDNMVDMTVLRPLSRALTLPLPSDAWNVNSLDEVPNSSWFTNRIGLFPLTPDEVGRGACGHDPDLDPARGPWIVTSGKPDGSNPGVVSMT